MKLDRNTNPDGRGKYALVNMRRLSQLKTSDATNYSRAAYALDILSKLGILHFGNEGPGEQFFVLKYKDRFTWAALTTYFKEVRLFAELNNDPSLHEYAEEIRNEAGEAVKVGNRIPD